MISRASLAALGFLLSASSGALAANATPEEATRLTGVFETYLGKTPGVIAVTPAGESYNVKIDFAPLFAKPPSKDFAASVTPIVMTLTGLGGGKWQVGQDQPLSITVRSPGIIELSASVGALRGTGVFDESIAAFTSSTTDLSDMSVEETLITPDAGPTHVAYAVKQVHYETAMEAAQGGGVDGTVNAVMTGMAETFSIPAMPGAAPVDVNVAVASGKQMSVLKGLRSRAILDLMAWFVSHPSPESLAASQAELKNLLRAGLPLFESVSGTGTVEKLSASSPVGPIGADKLDFAVSMNGIVADGRLQERFSVSGLTLPPGLVPAWAADIVPTAITFDFMLSDFNAAAPAAIMLDNLDLSAKPPLKPELDKQLLAALLPKGAVTVSLGPSSVISKLAEIAAEGSVTAGPMALPAGQATVKAKGIDQLMQAIQVAPPELGLGQMTGILIIAKGLSKPEPDGSISWKIETTPTGGVLINGVDPLQK